jgi:hypothetical protein
MMDRRTFLVRDIPAATIGLAAAWKSSFAAIPMGDKPVSSFYIEFYYIHMQNGSQPPRMAKWLETRLMPICQKHGFGPMGFFNVDVGPNLPSTLIVFSYPSLAEMEAQWGRLNADPDYAAAAAEVEKDEPAFYRVESVLLRSTSFCPPLTPTPAGDTAHKLFELRIYESPTNRQLGYLHDRFGGGEIDIFHKSGIHPILYADTVFGPNQPNMAYLIPFENADQREKAWATFRNDPDWVKIRDESIRHGGEIVRNITNMFLSPMSFSMLR